MKTENCYHQIKPNLTGKCEILEEHLEVKKAPKKLIDSVSAFQDDNIAEKALELLNEKNIDDLRRQVKILSNS